MLKDKRITEIGHYEPVTYAQHDRLFRTNPVLLLVAYTNLKDNQGAITMNGGAMTPKGGLLEVKERCLLELTPGLDLA